MLACVEERGSAYLPEVNAFHIREFQMMHAAEDAARFLHHACRGLPHRMNGAVGLGSLAGRRAPNFAAGLFLYASGRARCSLLRFASALSFEACTRRKFACTLARCDRKGCTDRHSAATREKLESSAQNWGYIIGSQIYRVYLAGKVKPGGAAATVI